MTLESVPETPVVSSVSALPPDKSPEVTYKANGFDLTALGALAGGLAMLLTCLSCNLFTYLLPIGVILMGILGVAFAGSSVNPRRTRIFSLIGLGSGLVVFLVIGLFFVLYFGLIIVMMLTTRTR